jgi:hypothetical protein
VCAHDMCVFVSVCVLMREWVCLCAHDMCVFVCECVCADAGVGVFVCVSDS